jgi:hypothetical protein
VQESRTIHRVLEELLHSLLFTLKGYVQTNFVLYHHVEFTSGLSLVPQLFCERHLQIWNTTHRKMFGIEEETEG